MFERSLLLNPELLQYRNHPVLFYHFLERYSKFSCLDARFYVRVDKIKQVPFVQASQLSVSLESFCLLMI